MFKKYRGVVQAGVSGASMFMAMQMSNLMLSSGWDGFSNNLQEFFEQGMSGSGLPALGLALIAIGIFGAAVFFVVHKVNQQSSLPRPGGFLIIALVGVMLREHERIIVAVEKVRDILFGWFGL